MQKRPPKRYFRAGRIFLKTPFFKVKRGFPEPVSGIKRKIFALNVFVTEAWKVAARRKKVSSQSFLAGEAFSDYICRLDDILDQARRPSIVSEQSKYKEDKLAKQIISGFVGHVRKLPLTKREQREIIRLVSDFRRSAFATLAKFEKTPTPTKQEIIKMKEHTTGGMVRAGISILHVCERLPPGERQKLEDAFSDAFMAAQIADDIVDMKLDRQNRVPNLALSVLGKRPEELKKALQRNKMTVGWFRKNCPESHSELMVLGEEYLSKIPQTTAGLQTLATIPRIFWKMGSLTARK